MELSKEILISLTENQIFLLENVDTSRMSYHDESGIISRIVRLKEILKALEKDQNEKD